MSTLKSRQPNCADRHPVMRFRAITDAHPHAVSCVLQHLHARKIVPRDWATVHLTEDFIEIKIEIADLSPAAFQQIIEEVDDMPMVIAAIPYDIDWTTSQRPIDEQPWLM